MTRSSLPQSRNTPERVTKYQTAAKKAPAFAKANLRHNQELTAARKRNANRPAAIAAKA